MLGIRSRIVDKAVAKYFATIRALQFAQRHMGLQPRSLGFVEALGESQVDGSALTAAARASCLPPQAKRTIPPNFFRFVGQQVRLRATGRISCAVTTPGTARFDLALDAVVAFDTLAMNLNVVAKTNVGWHLDVLLTCRAVGTSANLMGQGVWESEAVVGSPLPTAGGSGTLLVPYNTAPVVGANFDSTISHVVDFFFTQTVATGSMTLHQYSLESLN